jgi:CHAD domain-containing protein
VMLRAQHKVDRRLGKKLASARFERLITTVENWIMNGPWLLTGRSIRSEHIDTYAQARLHAWRATISRQGRHLRVLHRKQLHRLRIRCERYRYVLAALHSLAGC